MSIGRDNGLEPATFGKTLFGRFKSVNNINTHHYPLLTVTRPGLIFVNYVVSFTNINTASAIDFSTLVELSINGGATLQVNAMHYISNNPPPNGLFLNHIHHTTWAVTQANINAGGGSATFDFFAHLFATNNFTLFTVSTGAEQWDEEGDYLYVPQ